MIFAVFEGSHIPKINKIRAPKMAKMAVLQLTYSLMLISHKFWMTEKRIPHREVLKLEILEQKSSLVQVRTRQFETQWNSNSIKSELNLALIFQSDSGNFMIFTSLRFYMKSILGIVQVQNLPFLQFSWLWISIFGKNSALKKCKNS